jgi:alkaline phosphatase
LIKEGKKMYLKRVKEIAKKLAWIKTQPADTLVILTSDHAELFTDTKSFHHGNFALKDQAIFDVPLLIREHSTTKKIIRYHIYDYLLPKIIFDKLEKSFESAPKYLIKLNQQLSNELDKTRTELKQLNNIVNNIKQSKTFRLWQAYCKIRDKILKI